MTLLELLEMYSHLNAIEIHHSLMGIVTNNNLFCLVIILIVNKISNII